MSDIPGLVASTSIPAHCTPVSGWLRNLSSAFSVCVPTNLAFVSTALGNLTILAWLFAQLPQVYKNYQLQSAAGLSIIFLCEWFLGDLTNLIGGLLTKQALWQVVLASYYVTVDVILLCQYVWYSRSWSRGKTKVIECSPANDRSFGGTGGIIEGVTLTNNDVSSEESDGGKTNLKTEPKRSDSPQSTPKKAPGSTETCTFSEKDVFLFPREQTDPIRQSRTQGPRRPFSMQGPLLLASMASLSMVSALPTSPAPVFAPIYVSSASHQSTAQAVGRVLSWISTACYLLSRLPQIIKNAKRKSTSGLSPSLFIAAFCGNLCYSTSILTNPLAWGSYPPHGLHGWVGHKGSDQWTWIKLAIPFWLGAAGVLVMDGIIGLQFLIYGAGPKVIITVEEVGGSEDGEGVGPDRTGAEAEAGAGGDGIGNRGRTRWRKVTGWMRGWVPSPQTSPPRHDPDSERAPLVSRNSQGAGPGAGESERQYGVA